MLYHVMKLVAKSPGHHMSTSNELVPNHISDYDDLINTPTISKDVSMHSFLGNKAAVGGNQILDDRKGARLDKPRDNIASAKEEELLYFDKPLAKIKVPEVIVCFDNIDGQTVKDICIDERMHPFEKVLLENTDVNKKISSIPKHMKNANSDLHAVIDDFEPSKDLKVFPIFDKDHGDQISSLNFTGNRDEPNNAHKTTTGIVAQKISLLELFSLEESNSDLLNFNSGDDHKRFSSRKNFEEVELENASSFTIVTNDSAQNCEMTCPKGLSFTRPYSPSEPCESSKMSERQESPTNDSAEGSSRAMHVASDGVVISTVENPVNSTIESGITSIDAKCGPTKSVFCNNSGHETAIFRTSSARNSYYYNNQTDLLGPCPFSGPKYSSGHITFSGSASLRSDSSTASTRSFAFPILQTEWNSSPARMAKAECRGFKRNRSWLMRFICCKV